MIFKSRSGNDDKIDETRLKNAFQKIKKELDEHLDTINENTTEINKLSGYLEFIEQKIDKVNEKLDEIFLTIESLGVENNKKIKLTSEEQKIFLVLYTFGEKNSLSYTDVANKIDMTELEVRGIIKSLIKKKIPIIEERINEKSFFNIAKEFRIKQSKENILNIDESVSRSFLERNLSKFFR